MDGEVRAIRDEEALLRMFVGRNPEPFVRILRAAQGNRFESGGLNAACFFLPIVWFFYRKMFLYGAIAMLAPFILALLISKAMSAAGIGLAVAIAFSSNFIYVTHARRRIARIERFDLAESVRDDLIRAAGGTSVAGALFGGAVSIAMVVVALASTSKVLPACNSDMVRDMIHKGIVEERQR